MFVVHTIPDDARTYYLIKNENGKIELLPTKYLVYRMRVNRSPNTVKADAHALKYYWDYLENEGITYQEVLRMHAMTQQQHFTGFLHYIQHGTHKTKKYKGTTSNRTCNLYLKKVFHFYKLIAEMEDLPKLKVLVTRESTYTNAVGVKKTVTHQEFPGRLRNEESRGKCATREEIEITLSACTNIRDVAFLSLLKDTGQRVGEALGINWKEDLNLEECSVRVYFRGDNENHARAKNAEYRDTMFSQTTRHYLEAYINEYKELLEDSKYLFVVLSGENRGKALNVNAVYGMLRRMEEKTQVKITPHMIRHYFAEERRKAGWDIFQIQTALGHRNPSTTERYLNNLSDEVKKASEKYFEEENNKALCDITGLIPNKRGEN